MEDQSPPYKVQLPAFEGPLDLLLHLIKINEVDIYDIPIAIVTEQYLQYLGLMKELNLDIASEYLVMAATLAHIKSRMLLPSAPPDGEESEKDPRNELVQRLLDYQRYKKAAEELEDKEILGRDVFPRPGSEENGGGELTVNLFDLIEALKGILEKVDAEEGILDFTKEKISLKDRMVEVIERLEAVEYLIFQDLFSSAESRYEIILTFMALLELIRNQKVRILQLEMFGTIRIHLREG
jgi:segregation and condensation protein A